MAFVKKGVVLPLGATDDFDDLETRDQAIIKHAGRFFLYYSGNDGSNRRVGLAISKDGITFVKKGVVLPLGATNDFDDVGAFLPAIIKHAGRFFLYYTAFCGSRYRIGLAISKDGITFVKKGVVVPLGAGGDFDSGGTESIGIIKHAGRFFLYYTGYNGSNHRIGLAISKDGITFVKKGVVLPLGATNDFDSAEMQEPSIIKHAGRFFLYYNGGDGSNYRIGLAISKDGITFVKKGVVVPLGAIDDFDDVLVSTPSIIKHAGRFFLYYGGHNGSNWRTGLAISKDGL